MAPPYGLEAKTGSFILYRQSEGLMNMSSSSHPAAAADHDDDDDKHHERLDSQADDRSGDFKGRKEGHEPREKMISNKYDKNDNTKSSTCLKGALVTKVPVSSSTDESTTQNSSVSTFNLSQKEERLGVGIPAHPDSLQTHQLRANATLPCFNSESHSQDTFQAGSHDGSKDNDNSNLLRQQSVHVIEDVSHRNGQGPEEAALGREEPLERNSSCTIPKRTQVPFRSKSEVPRSKTRPAGTPMVGNKDGCSVPNNFQRHSTDSSILARAQASHQQRSSNDGDDVLLVLAKARAEMGISDEGEIRSEDDAIQQRDYHPKQSTSTSTSSGASASSELLPGAYEKVSGDFERRETFNHATISSHSASAHMRRSQRDDDDDSDLDSCYSFDDDDKINDVEIDMSHKEVVDVKQPAGNTRDHASSVGSTISGNVLSTRSLQPSHHQACAAGLRNESMKGMLGELQSQSKAQAPAAEEDPEIRTQRSQELMRRQQPQACSPDGQPEGGQQ
jgi:hypothetical protein